MAKYLESTVSINLKVAVRVNSAGEQGQAQAKDTIIRHLAQLITSKGLFEVDELNITNVELPKEYTFMEPAMPEKPMKSVNAASKPKEKAPKYSLEEMEGIARDKGVDITALQNKYKEARIYKMRLAMAIKAASK